MDWLSPAPFQSVADMVTVPCRTLWLPHGVLRKGNFGEGAGDRAILGATVEGRKSGTAIYATRQVCPSEIVTTVRKGFALVGAARDAEMPYSEDDCLRVVPKIDVGFRFLGEQVITGSLGRGN